MHTNKRYVSDIDRVLKAFDQSHPKSAAQWAEIQKYKRIQYLRDNAQPPAQNTEDTLLKD